MREESLRERSQLEQTGRKEREQVVDTTLPGRRNTSSFLAGEAPHPLKEVRESEMG